MATLHISSSREPAVAFPVSDRDLPDDCSRTLSGMSSPLPQGAVRHAVRRGHDARPRSRAYIFNPGLADMIAFLDVIMAGLFSNRFSWNDETQQEPLPCPGRTPQAARLSVRTALYDCESRDQGSGRVMVAASDAPR